MVQLTKIQAQKKALLEKLEQLKVREQRAKALEQTRISAAQRRQDTRRKVLLGAWALSKMERDAEFKATHMAEISTFMVRETDRALFGLPGGTKRPAREAKAEP